MNTPMSEESRPNLQSLVGDELSSVCFVRDYIELHFDGPVLRCLGDVFVRGEKGVKQSGDDGFRDCLCRNIGDTVLVIGPAEGNEIEIEFSGNNLIRIVGREPGVEFAHFISFPDKSMQIWEMDEKLT